METTHNSVKVKLGIKVMKLVESLIGREVTVGQGSECHLTNTDLVVIFLGSFYYNCLRTLKINNSNISRQE